MIEADLLFNLPAREQVRAVRDTSTANADSRSSIVFYDGLFRQVPCVRHPQPVHVGAQEVRLDAWGRQGVSDAPE